MLICGHHSSTLCTTAGQLIGSLPVTPGMLSGGLRLDSCGEHLEHDLQNLDPALQSVSRHMRVTNTLM